MREMSSILYILEKGLEKHGELPLTNKWLINIIKKAENFEYTEALREQLPDSSDLY